MRARTSSTTVDFDVRLVRDASTSHPKAHGDDAHRGEPRERWVTTRRRWGYFRHGSRATRSMPHRRARWKSNRQSLAIDASSRVYAPSPSMDDPSRSPRVARRRKHDNGRHERARSDDGDEKWGRDTLPRRIGISLRFCPVGGANHSHRSRVRAERRTVVVEIAPKRYVRALTTLARARESERAFFFAATRRSRGSRMGPIGESSPCGVPTDRRRDAARRACAPHDDCRRCARRARRRPRSISESASLRLPRRSFSRIFGEEETCVPSSPLFANASSMV